MGLRGFGFRVLLVVFGAYRALGFMVVALGLQGLRT